jgi:hypothetical protein
MRNVMIAHRAWAVVGLSISENVKRVFAKG